MPSIRTRLHFLQNILGILLPQITGEVQLCVDVDDGDVAIGEKRNRLLSVAAGTYTTFIDDDDVVNDAFVGELLLAIRKNPSANYFAPTCFRSHNGCPHVPWPYPFPGHIGPVRTSLLRSVGFPAEKDAGEDNDMSEALREYPGIGAGVLVPAAHYTYRFRSDRTGEKTHAGYFNAEARCPWVR